MVASLAGEVPAETGSCVGGCVVGVNKKGEEALPEERTEAYDEKRPCAELVHLAAEVVGRRLMEL